MNHPCLIGDPSCQNPDGFDFALIPPNTSSATLSSPTYTVNQIRTIVGGDTFEVGLDLNQAMGKADGAYDLLRFTLSVNGTIFFSTTDRGLLLRPALATASRMPASSSSISRRSRRPTRWRSRQPSRVARPDVSSNSFRE